MVKRDNIDKAYKLIYSYDFINNRKIKHDVMAIKLITLLQD